MNTDEMTKEDFLLSLLEFHRTIKLRDSFVYGSHQYLVRCQACDGVNTRVWIPGEPEYECEIWRMAKQFGLAK